MTITARYRSRCRVCGQLIEPGTQIEWSRTEGSRHLECPTPAAAEPVQSDQPTWTIHVGEGYGGRPFRVGEVVRTRPHATWEREGVPEYAVVLHASERYYREEGMSFGVGDERGSVYTAVVRAATEAESAPLRERLAQAQRRAEARRAWDAAVRQIMRAEHYVEQWVDPQGDERLEILPPSDPRAYYTPYVVLSPEYMSVIERTGEGTHLWRAPRDEALVATLRAAHAVVRG